MSPLYDAVLLIAFGGPTDLKRSDRSGPCHERHSYPPERFEEVVHHYEAVGGKSPSTKSPFARRALKNVLQESTYRCRYTGMRNASPFCRNARTNGKDGIRRALGSSSRPTDRSELGSLSEERQPTRAWNWVRKRHKSLTVPDGTIIPFSSKPGQNLFKRALLTSRPTCA